MWPELGQTQLHISEPFAHRTADSWAGILALLGHYHPGASEKTSILVAAHILIHSSYLPFTKRLSQLNPLHLTCLSHHKKLAPSIPTACLPSYLDHSMQAVYNLIQFLFLFYPLVFPPLYLKEHTVSHLQSLLRKFPSHSLPVEAGST